MTNLQAFLSVDNKQFLSEMRKSQTAVDGFARNFESRLGKVGGLLSGTGSTTGQKYFNTISKGASGADKAIGKFTGNLERMGNVFTTGLGLGVAYAGLNAITGAFQRGIEKAQEFETGILSIAAAQQAAFDIKVGDRILEGVEGFEASLSLAYDINDKLLKRSTQNILTYREQLSSFLVSTAQAGKLGLTVDQQVELTEKLAVASKALGLQGQQISQQIRAVLGGANVQKTVLGSALGLTNADVKKMKEAGTLYEDIIDRVKGFKAGDEFFANSIEGALSQFENAIDVFLSQSGKKIVSMVREPLKEIEEFLQSTGGEELGETLGHLFANLLELLLALAKSPALDIIKNFLGFMATMGDKIVLAGIFIKLGGVLKNLLGVGGTFLNFLKATIVQTELETASVDKQTAAIERNTMAKQRNVQSARGGNAPGRMAGVGAAGAQLALDMPYTNKAGRDYDPKTGRLVPMPSKKGPSQPSLFDMPLTTGNAANEYYELEQRMLAKKQLETAKAAMAQNNAVVTKGWTSFYQAQKATVANSFAALRSKVAAIDTNAVIGKLGLAAMVYGLSVFVKDAIQEQYGDAIGNEKQAIDTALTAGQGALVGASLAGPIGALVGTMIGGFIGIQNILAEEEKKAAEAWAGFQDIINKDPVTKRIMELKEKIQRQQSALTDANVTEVGKKAAQRIIDQAQQELAQTRKDGGIQRAAKRAAEEAEKLMEEIQAKIQEIQKKASFVNQFATSAGDKSLADTISLRADLLALDAARKNGMVANMRLPGDAAQAKRRYQQDSPGILKQLPIQEDDINEVTANRLALAKVTQVYESVAATYNQLKKAVTTSAKSIDNANKSLTDTQREYQRFQEDIGPKFKSLGDAVSEAHQAYRRFSEDIGRSKEKLKEAVTQAGYALLEFSLPTDNQTSAKLNAWQNALDGMVDEARDLYQELAETSNDTAEGRQKIQDLNKAIAEKESEIRGTKSKIDNQVDSRGFFEKAKQEALVREQIKMLVDRYSGGLPTRDNFSNVDDFLQSNKMIQVRYFADLNRAAQSQAQAQVKDLTDNLVDAQTSEVRGLQDLAKQRENLAIAIQTAQTNYARGVEDMALQNEAFKTRIADAQNAVTEATQAYQKAVNDLTMSTDGLQLAMAQINSQFAKLGKPEVKVDFGTINITVSAELKERIDQEQLSGMIQENLSKFVVDSCRNVKR